MPGTCVEAFTQFITLRSISSSLEDVNAIP
jgi:hypothetical protein